MTNDAQSGNALAGSQQGTAPRDAIAPELAALDKRLGKLVVNRFTYRLLRLLGRFVRPPFDPAGISLDYDHTGGERIAIITPETRSCDGA